MASGAVATAGDVLSPNACVAGQLGAPAGGGGGGDPLARAHPQATHPRRLPKRPRLHTPARRPAGPKAAWTTCKPEAAKAGCRREEILVAPGSTTTLRVINAAALVYMTVCVGGHEAAVVNADSRPVEPRVFADGCFDVNSGQRLDVLLKANKAPGAYWITGAHLCLLEKGRRWSALLHERRYLSRGSR